MCIYVSNASIKLLCIKAIPCSHDIAVSVISSFANLLIKETFSTTKN